MNHTNRLFAIALAVATSVCADQSAEMTAPPVSTAVIARNSGSAAGERIAELVAIAAREPSVRSELTVTFRRSRNREHKLILQRHLVSDKGQLLRMAIIAAATRGQWDALALLSTLPELEMYAPVKTHRATIEDGRISLVAIRVNSIDPIIASTQT